MGHKTTIFGYIECSNESLSENQLAIARFSFDEVFPFINGFGRFTSTYRGSTIPFSMNIKGDSNSNWCEWVSRFEQLLDVLDYQAASVIFASEMQSRRRVLDFVSTGKNSERFESWVVDS